MDVIIDNYPILVKNLIPIIRDDVFYPLYDSEFFFIQNIQYRNLFKSNIYTPLSICIPIQNSIKIEPIRDSTIETFIKYLVEDFDSFRILIQVLINFHKEKFKSNYAFVLIGDENSTNILIDEIIKPLFASKDEYFSIIDDEGLEKKSDTKIIENKIKGDHYMQPYKVWLFSDLIDEWIVSLFYTNSEIGDTKLGLSASKYFEESIPFNSVKFKNFDVIYTKKNLDPRIFLFYDSMTGNTERFVKKVAKVLIEDLKKDVYVIKIDDNSLLGSNERGHLVTWTNGYVKDGKDEKKRIPHRTLNFVKNNKNNILTVSSTGQKNWGKNDFGSAVDTINENYGIKKGLKVELSGNKEEVQKYVEMIKEIYEQEVYDIEQQSKYKRF